MAHDMQHDTDAGGGDSEEAGADFVKAYELIGRYLAFCEVEKRHEGEPTPALLDTVLGVLIAAHTHVHDYPDEFHLSVHRREIGGFVGDGTEPPTRVNVTFGLLIRVEMDHPIGGAPDSPIRPPDSERLN